MKLMKRFFMLIIAICTINIAFSQGGDLKTIVEKMQKNGTEVSLKKYSEAGLNYISKKTESPKLKEALKNMVSLTIVSAKNGNTNELISYYNAEMFFRDYLTEVKSEITPEGTTNIHFFKTKEDNIKEIYYVKYKENEFFDLIYLIGKVNIDDISTLSGLIPTNVLSAINPEKIKNTTISSELSKIVTFLDKKSEIDIVYVVDGKITDGSFFDLSADMIDSLVVEKNATLIEKYGTENVIFVTTKKKTKKDISTNNKANLSIKKI